MKSLFTGQRPRFWQWKKRRLPLRLRLALWSAGLVLVLSFALLFFINTVALSTFPRIVRQNFPSTAITARNRVSTVPPAFISPLRQDLLHRSLNPPEISLLLELRSISLAGLCMVAVLGGAGAYWLAGIALRPVRNNRSSHSAMTISFLTSEALMAIIASLSQNAVAADHRKREYLAPRANSR